MQTQKRFDVAIIGSGFAGSILASILAKRNLRVVMIDSTSHPRFAIGESSTPIADIVLRRLGRTYDLPELVSLSTWGSWQRDHHRVTCGCKRGFSYFAHSLGHEFSEPSLGDRSLLVAASSHDDVADTHWYRPEVDHFLHSLAVAQGATALDNHEVVGIESVGNGYSVQCKGKTNRSVEATWVIDASGRAGTTAKLCDGVNLIDQMRTRTHSVFAHYRGVGKWTGFRRDRGEELSDDPFDADDAAQHHVLQDGWLWMLRFCNGITSVGYTTKMERSLEYSGYPSIELMMEQADRTAPHVAPHTSPKRDDNAIKPQSSGRLQRFYDPLVADRIVMLPTAAVTIDPLHSTGIAHAIAGVDRVADLLLETDTERKSTMLREYRSAVIDETRLADRLVHTAYETMQDFPRFTVACMLYFAGAIRCEERFQSGDQPAKLWNADDDAFVEFVHWACDLLCDPTVNEFHDMIEQRMRPWNTAGLMNPEVKNRYAYTATKSS